MLTGTAVIALPLAAPYPPSPLDPLPVAIHLLSFELLLVWLPFGKLAHAFLVFVSCGMTGACPGTCILEDTHIDCRATGGAEPARKPSKEVRHGR